MSKSRQERAEIAHKMHMEGCNCAQVVVTYFCEQLGVDRNTSFRMAEGFGLGTGDTEQICGAVSGAIMLAGLKNSGGYPIQGERTAGDTYQLSNAIKERFYHQNGSIICRELKGIGTGRVLRSCDDCITDAIEIAADVLGLED